MTSNLSLNKSVGLQTYIYYWRN